MKNLKRYIGIFVAALLGMILWSCKDDSVKIQETEDSEKVTVRFLIPESGPSFGYDNTRATDADLENSYLGSGEGAISNLYIIAVQLSYFNYLSNDDNMQSDNILNDPAGLKYIEQDMSKDGDSGRQRVIINPINVYDFEGIINKEKAYNLTLYPGRYRFYAFANCDLYVNNLYEAGGIYSEDYIRQLAIYYSSETPLKLAHLPMSCTPEMIKYDNADGTNQEVKPNTSDKENYTVPIYKNTQANIHLNLHFMCSKVRYTILFDDTQPYKDKDGNWNEGISSGFGNQSIRFYVDEMGENRPVATNLRNKTFLYPNLDVDSRLAADKNDPFIMNSSVSSELPSEGYFSLTRDDIDARTAEYANWPAPLNRYQWPEDGDKYPKRPMDVLDPYTGTLDDWKASRKRAWQGVVYLPENPAYLYTSSNERVRITTTELHFPYVLDTYALNEGTDDEIPYKDGEVTGAYKTLKLFGNSSETQYEGSDGQSYKDPYGDELKREDYSSGLERGVFYDVVARVITPDKWDLSIIVYGKVEPWHEIEQTITEGPNPDPNPGQNQNSDPSDSDLEFHGDVNQWESNEGSSWK